MTEQKVACQGCGRLIPVSQAPLCDACIDAGE